jgi:hypothetical protein
MTTTTSFDSIANSFYLAFYGRPADPVGLKFWSQQVANVNGDLTSIVDAFATSAEAQVRFADDSTSTRITEIYQQLFNRDPEATGLAFWQNAVEKGNASLADVALAILKGSQGTDSQLVDLRQQAMDKFTAEVEASGSAYEGTASIEAARILVRAVTLNATGTDIDTLVKAAVSFADTATKTPAVVNAIATGTTLNALFDTVRGSADPVALAQTLADTAKAAAGNPATLDSLLRGGGMAQVLKVMPANATLTDVVKALASGGLPAAVEVVYPSTPSTPVSPLTLAFKGVEQSLGDTHNDNVTNVKLADVSFSFSKALTSGQHFEYSVDGKTWSSEGIDTTSATKTVTIKDLDLSHGTSTVNVPLPNLVHLQYVESHPDLQTTVNLRAVDAAGNAAASASQAVVYDSYAAAPSVKIGGQDIGSQAGVADSYVTSQKTFVLGNLEQGAKVEYMFDLIQTSQPIDGGAPSGTIIGSTGEWVAAPLALHDGLNAFSVRQTDAAGNVSAVKHIVVTVETPTLAVPGVALENDTGIDTGDGITGDGKVVISGLSTDTATGWDYSLDEGKSWTPGGANDGSGKAVLDLSLLPQSSGYLTVRQHDAAGHDSEASTGLTFTFDDTAPTTAVAFDRIGTGTAGAQTTDAASADVSFTFARGNGDIVQYQLDGTTDSSWITLNEDAYADGTVTVKGVDFSLADHTVNVRVIDAAGNVGNGASVAIDSTANDVKAPSTMSAVTPDFSLGKYWITLSTTPDHIVASSGGTNGFADAGSIMIQAMTKSENTTEPVTLDGNSMSLNGTTLAIGEPLPINVYGLKWEDKTFATDAVSGKGYVSSGMATFAGGVSGDITVEGFAFKSFLQTASVDASADVDPVSTMYIGSNMGPSHIITGGAMDVIVENGLQLTVGYNSFDSKAQDLILDFVSGDDVIELDGEAASLIDDNHDGELSYTNFGTSINNVVTNASGELVQATVAGALSTSNDAFDVSVTLATLNNSFNVAGMAQGDDVLIIANGRDGNSGILYFYAEQDGNGKIDAKDLTVVASFGHGVVNAIDIQLVGVQGGSPEGSGGGIPGG